MKIHVTLAAALSLALSAWTGSQPAGGTSLERATRAFRAGDYAQVLELAAALGRDSCDWPKVQYLAGETALVLGRNEEAERSFRDVLAARSEAVPARTGLGRALTRLGKTDEAARMLDAALASAPEDVGALAARGELHAALGKLDEAKRDLESAWKLDPKNPLTVRAYVEVLLLADDGPGAAGIIESFTAARPEHPLGPFLLAIVMEREGDDGEALAQYKEALTRDPSFIDAHKNLAILSHTLSNTYQDKVRTKLAFEHYERYFALGGKDAELRAMYDNLLQFKDQILGM